MKRFGFKITPFLMMAVIVTIMSSPRGAWASTSGQERPTSPPPTPSLSSSSSSSVDSADVVNVVPLIDLSCNDDDQLAKEISLACSTIGFFQVKSHGISEDLIQRFRQQCELYFEHLSITQKKSWKRNGSNSRGFFDDELTKRKRDWKECLDVGVPGSRKWDAPDDSILNACLDGFNQFPSAEELPHFRETIVEYFEACAKLSDRLSQLMARGMGLPHDDPFITDLKEQHSSYLRMNYYPPCNPNNNHPSHQQQQQQGRTDPNEDDKNNDNNDHPLGISPHKDAGFLTVLLQDDDCHSLQAMINGEWVSMNPTPGAFTINTGDMAQIWSDGKYKAPLHRVLTNPNQKRYSAPFFYNPGYKTLVKPVATTTTTTTSNNDASGSSSISSGNANKYVPVLWGYFRAVRFAGDLTNFGVEIQIENFETNNKIPSAHLARQETFYEKGWHGVPFDVEAYRGLLRRHPD